MPFGNSTFHYSYNELKNTILEYYIRVLYYIDDPKTHYITGPKIVLFSLDKFS